MSNSCSLCGFVHSMEEIDFPTCQHLSHNDCLEAWSLQKGTCPKCNDTEEEKDDHYEKIKEDLRKSEEAREELRDKMKALTDDNRKQIAQLSKDVDVKAKEIQTLQMHVEMLEKEKGVQSLFEKINEFNAENSKLRQKLKESECANVISDQKVKILEQRLEYVSSELKKQYANSLGQGMNNDSMIPQKQERRNRGKNRQGQNAQSKLQNSSPERGAPSIAEAKTFEMRNPTDTDTRIIIKNFKRKNLVYPLNDTIILLANKMSISVLNQEISEVKIIDSKYDKVSLVIAFKNIDKKVEFLRHKNRLKSCPSTKFLIMKEYIDQSIYSVFIYANRRLRHNGFEFVGVKEDQVIAKKKLNEPDKIIIRDKSHVDLLLGQQNEAGRSTSEINLDRSSLYMYATSELRGVYEYIGFEGDQVIAKMYITEPDHIVLRDTDHVDSLLAEHNFKF